MPERSHHRTAAIAAVSVATVVWGSVGVFVKSTSLSGVTFAMYRLWLGVLVHLIALVVTRRRLAWTTFRACAPGGALFALDISLGFSAVKLTTVANAAIIGALSPILITLAAGRMFGERPARREVGLIALSFLGVGVVAVGSSGQPAWSPAGDLLALAGTVSWTAYWLFSKRARAEASALEYMTSVMIAAALTVTPLALLLGGVPPAVPTPRDWVVLVAVALLPGMTGHLLVAWSHRHVESWLSALITQCSPVISAGMAWPVLGEPLTPPVVAGGLVVVASTAVVIVSTSRRERERLAAAEAEIEPVTELPA